MLGQLPKDILNLLAEVVSPVTLRECRHIPEMQASFKHVLLRDYHSLEHLDYIATKYAIDNDMADTAIQLYSLLKCYYKFNVIDYIIDLHHSDKINGCYDEAHQAIFSHETHSLSALKTCVNVIRKHIVTVNIDKKSKFECNDSVIDVIVAKDHPILKLMLEDPQPEYSSRICPCRLMYNGNDYGGTIECGECGNGYVSCTLLPDIAGVYYEFIFCYKGVFVNYIANKYGLGHHATVSDTMKELIREQHK
jgi:hypothetical protein